MFKLLADSESELLVGGAAVVLSQKFEDVSLKIGTTVGPRVAEASSTAPLDVLATQPEFVSGVLSNTPNWL